MNRKVVLCLSLISFVFTNGCLANQADNDAAFNTDRGPFLLAKALGKIEEVTQEGMQRWGVPGLALAIVKDGKIILIKGFGYRDLDKTVAVTPDTHFLLASMTKAFTALTLGLLVEDGVIGWDTPVSEREPGFRLSNPQYTSRVTLRDMLSHRTGLETRDALWASGEHSVQEIYERLDELAVVSPLRERFEYHNIMYIAASLLVEKLTGEDWTDLGRKRLLNPLNMPTTGFSTEEFQSSGNYSIGFRVEDGELVENRLALPEDNAWYTSRGSGSMFSNAREMAHWVLFQLGDGHFEGRRVVATEILQATHEAQISLQEPPSYLDFTGITDHAYAMGWYLDNYRGHQRWHHGGATPMGYSNYITLFPDDNIGMVILSNRFVFMPVELMHQISDILLGLLPEPWTERFAGYLQ